MRYGWLVVNQYYKTPKFIELYDFLQAAAEENGVCLERIDHAQIVIELQARRLLRPETRRPDFILFWDKDIKLAASLEQLGFRLFNRAESIKLCDDKALTYMRLSEAHIAQPTTLIPPFTYQRTPRTDDSYFRYAVEMLGLPLVFKECCGSFGYQVSLIRSFEQLMTRVTEVDSTPFILQRYISASHGRDVRINVVGGRVIASMLRVGAGDEFRSNLTLGGHSKVYSPSAAQRRAALDAANALGLDFAGVDVLFGENDEPLICEVNSNVHFKTTLDCTGVNLASCIIRHIIDTCEER